MPSQNLGDFAPEDLKDPEILTGLIETFVSKGVNLMPHVRDTTDFACDLFEATADEYRRITGCHE